ncbi:MAG: hypothetical protein NC123_05160 [Butyrivibrio sp.]|nr:hypothetical protein [Acetatifactor muris]MCM1558917.1 hypothetical protein [Butyrivibrio sp.]
MKELVVISRFIIVFMVAKYFFYQGIVWADEDMVRAYNILPHLMIVSYETIVKRKRIDILCTAMGIVYLIVCATRGPILLYVLFIAYSMFMQGKASKVVLVTGGISAVIFLSTSFGINMIKAISDFLEARGLSARIFTMFLGGNIASDNGRNILQNEVMKYVRLHPLAGNGLLSDRRATSVFSWTKWTIDRIEGWYSHNIIIELWCDFGYILGTVLLVFLTVLFVYTYKKLTGDKRTIYLVILFSSVLKLFMSSSYLEQRQFWLVVGIGITLYCQTRRQKKSMYNNADVYIKDLLT